MLELELFLSSEPETFRLQTNRLFELGGYLSPTSKQITPGQSCLFVVKGNRHPLSQDPSLLDPEIQDGLVSLNKCHSASHTDAAVQC